MLPNSDHNDNDERFDDEDLELDGDPVNDNDLETDPDEVANDNGQREQRPAPAPRRDPCGYRYVHSVPGRLEQLLDKAGYDPALIPSGLRRTAFELALCWQKRVFDEDDLVAILRFTRGSIRRATEALRMAARAGTVTG